MATITLTVPKNCAAVRVEEAGGELVISLELPDFTEGSPKDAEARSARAVTLTQDDREARRRAGNAARQKRYRERKRNAESVTERYGSVTERNESVTRYVTPPVVGKNECIFEDSFNEINPVNTEIQEKNNSKKIHSFLPAQKSVMRHVTRRNVTPEGQAMIPFLPFGAPPDLDPKKFPKLAEALEKYFEYRAFHGAPKMFPDYESKFWQFVQSALREFGEEKAAEIMDRNRRECRWFTLKVPPDMQLLQTGPPPEPEPAYDAGPEISPEEAEEVSRSIKEYLESLRKHKVPVLNND